MLGSVTSSELWLCLWYLVRQIFWLCAVRWICPERVAMKMSVKMSVMVTVKVTVKMDVAGGLDVACPQLGVPWLWNVRKRVSRKVESKM